MPEKSSTVTSRTAGEYASAESGKFPETRPHPLFQNISPTQIDHIQSLMLVHDLPPGIDLIRFGQSNHFLYFLITGTVYVYLRRESRGSIVLSILGPGELLGDLSALDSRPASASVKTGSDCHLLALAQQDFLACLENVPQIALNLLLLQATRIRRLTAHAEALAAMEIDERVVRQLLMLAEAHGRLADKPANTPGLVGNVSRIGNVFGEGRVVLPKTAVHIPLRLTQSDLASLCGSSIKQIQRTMSRLQSQRLVSIEAGYTITLNSPAQLHLQYLQSF